MPHVLTGLSLGLMFLWVVRSKRLKIAWTLFRLTEYKRELKELRAVAEQGLYGRPSTREHNCRRQQALHRKIWESELNLLMLGCPATKVGRH